MQELTTALSEPPAALTEAERIARFHRVYDRYGDYVYANLGRLGVPVSSVPDAFQEVFIVVHRRLEDASDERALRTWLFRVVLRVAADHRRAQRRRPSEELPEALAAHGEDPQRGAEQREAQAFVNAFLETLDESQRALFILTELEQQSVPEAAETLGLNVNTAWSRLRVLRQAFERAVQRLHRRTP
ncbi:MAG: sigma-70 family RNA polymerase sigma factor [Deltaproteobacteria bacterium]|nr:sigma-70 family RNA polymerase sigma factor [Deltaproteobacteria bacterium]